MSFNVDWLFIKVQAWKHPEYTGCIDGSKTAVVLYGRIIEYDGKSYYESYLWIGSHYDLADGTTQTVHYDNGSAMRKVNSIEAGLRALGK